MEKREILKKLEEEVSVIKDQELKKIAFEKLLDLEFEESPGKKGKRKKKAKQGEKTKSKIKSRVSQFYSLDQVREEVKKLHITGKINNLIDFKSCKKTWEQCLWVLAAAKKLKIDGLNNHEISFMLNKRLYKPIKYSTVNHIQEKVSDGLVIFEQEDKVWKITPDGEGYLKKTEREIATKTKK